MIDRIPTAAEAAECSLYDAAQQACDRAAFDDLVASKPEKLLQAFSNHILNGYEFHASNRPTTEANLVFVGRVLTWLTERPHLLGLASPWGSGILPLYIVWSLVRHPFPDAGIVERFVEAVFAAVDHAACVRQLNQSITAFKEPESIARGLAFFRGRPTCAVSAEICQKLEAFARGEAEKWVAVCA